MKLMNSAMNSSITVLKASKLLVAFGLLTPLGTAAAAPELTSKIVAVSEAGHDRFYSVAFDSLGNYYTAGSVAASVEKSADHNMVVAKFNASGALDLSFGDRGYAIVNVAIGTDGEVARSILLQADGKIILGGPVEHAGATDPRDRDIALVRLQTDGSLDKTFGKNGIALFDLSEGTVNGTGFIADGFGGIAFDAQNRILIHGSKKRDGGLDTDFVMLRTKADGSIDKSFGAAGEAVLDLKNLSASPKPPLVLPDGSILGAGYQRDGAVVVPVIYKLDDQGQLDTSFGELGIFSQAVLSAVTEVYAIALQGSSIVTVGYGRNDGPESLDVLSLRILENGSLDTSFGTGGGYTRLDVDGFNDNGRNMLTLPDGRLMLLGGGRYTSQNVDGLVAVLNPDGTPDESFGENGLKLTDFGGSNDFLWGAAISPTKDRVIAVGIKGVSLEAGNDDSVILNIPLNSLR